MALHLAVTIRYSFFGLRIFKIALIIENRAGKMGGGKKTLGGARGEAKRTLTIKLR